MTTILKRIKRAFRVASSRGPRVTFDAAKHAELGGKLWHGDMPTHYHVRTPLPTWMTDTQG